MKLLFDILKVQTKLEVAADSDFSAERLRVTMKECATLLFESAQTASVQWGHLNEVIQRLEKGDRK